MKTANDLVLDMYFKFIPKTRYAGLLRRSIAFFIDFLILSIVNYLLIIAFSLDITITCLTAGLVIILFHSQKKGKLFMIL
jgi:uncharacterized RDD family membrane protein YckC